MKGLCRLIPQPIRTAARRFIYKHSLTTSQAGQDYWVYGDVFNEKRGGYFVDIGAHDGIYLSNTYILESRYRWSGLCIEANPVTYRSLAKNRRVPTLNLCLDRSEGAVDFALKGEVGGIIGPDVDNKPSAVADCEVVTLKTASLNRVLEDHQAPSLMDYLSIDVEGAEERILDGLDLHKYAFRCATIERPTRNLRDRFTNHGYILVRDIPRLDCFYVHRDFVEEHIVNATLFHSKMHWPVRWR